MKFAKSDGACARVRNRLRSAGKALFLEMLLLLRTLDELIHVPPHVRSSSDVSVVLEPLLTNKSEPVQLQDDVLLVATARSRSIC